MSKHKPVSGSLDEKSSPNGWAGVARFDGVDLMHTIRRRWRWLAGGMGIGCVLAIAFYLAAPVKYESSAQILLMQKDSKLAAKGVESKSESESRVSEDLLATHMQIIQSAHIVNSALKKYGYDKLESIVNDLRKDETPVEYVMDRLYVTRGGKGQAKLAHVLNVGFRHTSDSESQEILDAVVASYQAFLAEKFQDVSREAANLIAQAKTDIAADLEKAEEEYRVFRENAPLLWKGDESANIHRVRYDELEATLSELRLQSASAKARLEVVTQAILDQKARNASDVEMLALLDDKHVDRLTLLVTMDKGDAGSAEFQADQPMRLESARAEHAALMNMIIRERSLLADLGPQHPQLQDVRRQISAAKGFLRETNERLGELEKKKKLTPRIMMDAYLELLRQDLITLEKRAEVVEDSAKMEHDEAKGLVSYELKADTLREEVKRKQQLYDAVIERLREINLVKDYGGFITEVIDPVQLGEKVFPKLPITLFIGLFLGLVLGAGGALFAEYKDISFHDLDDLRDTMGLPLLAMVPKLTLHERPAGATLSPTLETFYRPKSREAESFRGLRTSLFFSAQEKNQKVFACTSSKMGDGKSTVTANLAVSIAQSGRRVLLIDGDLRRPRQHELFGLKNTQGLSSVIVGEIEPADAIQSTPLAHLSIMPSGPMPANPAELLSSPKFHDLLDVVREKYDFVFVDCAPVLVVADPCIVASHVDGVIMAVKFPENTRPQVSRAKEMLADVGASIVGIVVNGVELAHGVSYGKYSYGYGYGDDGAGSYYVSDEEKARV